MPASPHAHREHYAFSDAAMMRLGGAWAGVCRRRLYRRFLAQYNLLPVDVALVKLNSQDWQHPFVTSHFG